MSLIIDGIEIQDDCTVLEGLSFMHVYFKGLRSSTKNFFESIRDESVYVCYTEGDEFYEYPNSTIIYLGNNTLYVSSLND